MASRIVKLSTLALDFDGTIARNDVLDPAVRESIAAVRQQGIVVVLVTGRILKDLRRVAGDLHFVDAVVAENGAVIEFPDRGYSKVVGQPRQRIYWMSCGAKAFPLQQDNRSLTPTPIQLREFWQSFNGSSDRWCSRSTAAA